MKRSEMLKTITNIIAFNRGLTADNLANVLLTIIEKDGMCPPKIEVRKVRPSNTRWGGGCTSRCICEECDPNFLVTEWELE